MGKKIPHLPPCPSPADAAAMENNEPLLIPQVLLGIVISPLRAESLDFGTRGKREMRSVQCREVRAKAEGAIHPARRWQAF